MPRRSLLVLFVLATLLLAAAPARPSGDSFTALLGEEIDLELLASRAPEGSGGEGGDTKLTSHGDFDQPDLFTGTASYRYELKLPPGTAGMEPKLALVYRSTNENGWFGLGWEMDGLGYIEYNYKFGVPRYDGTDKDFVLKMGGAAYELVPDDSNPDGGAGYYHTECETWMKIYFDGATWTVTGRNGTRWRFGGNPDSRVPIVDHSFIRLWALDRVEDVHGNYMTYSYVLDAPNGEYYPDKIVYTQNVNNTLRKLKTVRFLREPRTDNIRPHARWMTHRIKEILVDIDGTLVERWVLDYHYSNCSFRSLLASVSRYGNGDTPETTNFAYAADSGSLTWKLNSLAYSGGINISHLFSDFNGDGIMDYGSVGQQIIGYNVTIVGDEIKTQDVNCDGKDDIIMRQSDASDPIRAIYINNLPLGWIKNMTWKRPCSGVDIGLNNDGIVDYMCGTYNYLSSVLYDGWRKNDNYLVIGNELGIFEYQCVDLNADSWTDIYLKKSNSLKLNSRTGSWLSDNTWVLPSSGGFLPFLDVNSDGLSDYYLTNLYLNNGHGWHLVNWKYVDQYQFLFFGNNWHDYNNDGLLDDLEDDSVRFRRPDGSVQYVNKPNASDCAQLNDDPFLDFFYVWKNGSDTYFYRYFSNAKPDLLTQVKSPTGGSVGYEYKRMPVVSYMSKDENGNPLPSPIRRGGVWRQYVVSKVTTDEGTGRPDSKYTTTFDYLDDGLYDRSERTFLGFRRVKRTMPNGDYTITYFSQKPESAGRVEKVETYSAAGKLLREETKTWKVRAIGGSRGYAVVLAAEETRFHGESPRQGKTTYDYDSYGNVVREERQGEVDEAGTNLFPADDLRLERVYINRTDETYLLGLLAREKAQDGYGKVLTDKILWYDGLPYGQAAKGLLTEEKSWLDQYVGAPTVTDEAFFTANSHRPLVTGPGEPHPVVRYAYDAFGNRIGTVKYNLRSDGMVEAREETTVYDEEAHAFPVSQTNALGHTTTTTWDFGLGKPLSVTDPNGAVTRYVYDSLGRLKEEYGPRDQTNPKVRYDYTHALTGNPSTQYIKVERQTDPGTTSCIWARQYLDGFGRVWREEKQAPGGKVTVKVQQYEWHGKLAKEWLPFFSCTVNPDSPKTTVYDGLGRVVSVAMPDGAMTTYSYDGLATTITDANGHVTRECLDVFDRLVRVERPNDDGVHVTTFEYDPLGRKVAVKDPKYNAGEASVHTAMSYDSLGRLVLQTDPYAGRTSYAYDSVGNRVKKTDAKGNTLLYEYDLLDRLVTKSVLKPDASAPERIATFVYDGTTSDYGKGRLTSTCLGSSTPDASYRYDAEGNVTETTSYIGGTAYTSKTDYDALGRLRRLVYPDGTALDYGYEAEALKTVGSYAAYTQWNAAGQPEKATFGNNTTTTYTYDPKTLRLVNLTTYDPTGSVIQDYAYTFDRVGNITAILDNAPITDKHPFSTNQGFAYDALDRLVSSSLFGAYRYDKAGNITHKEGVDFFYEDPEHPYCSTRGTDGYEATYDANGNLITKRDKDGIYWRYEYDAENMLVKVYKGEAAGQEVLVEEYTYGADGKRKEKISYQNGEAIATGYIYLGENVIYETGPKSKLLIWGTAQLLAEKEGGEVTYNHPDHLGSTSVRTDSAGRVTAFVGNKPYGEFYTQGGEEAARNEDFNDAGQVAAGSDAFIDTARGIAYAKYTVEPCNEVLYSANYQSKAVGSEYVEVKSYSFTLVPEDYRRELEVEADIVGVFPTGYIRLELIKPDGGRELIKESVSGNIGAVTVSGTVSLEGRPSGKYRIAVSIKCTGTPFFIVPLNNILKVTLTSKRVYRSGILITTPMTVPFNAARVVLKGSVLAPGGTSVAWSVSTDGGSTWMPIALDGSVALPEPTRQIILRAALNATSTATPVIDSYRLMVYSVSPLDFGPRFTGKEMDHGTGLVYFGARYYDPEVGRFTTVDPVGDGLNWYSYCDNNPLKYVDPTGKRITTVTSVGWYSMSYQQGRGIVHSYLQGTTNTWFDRVGAVLSKVRILGDVLTGLGLIKGESDRVAGEFITKLDNTLNKYENQLKMGDVAILIRATTTTTQVVNEGNPFFQGKVITESTSYALYVINSKGTLLDSYSISSIGEEFLKGNLDVLLPEQAISVQEDMIKQNFSDPPTLEEAEDEYYD